jgi:hypothetical protein
VAPFAVDELPTGPGVIVRPPYSLSPTDTLFRTQALADGVAQVVDCLPSKGEALSLKKKKIQALNTEYSPSFLF